MTPAPHHGWDAAHEANPHPSSDQTHRTQHVELALPRIGRIRIVPADAADPRETSLEVPPLVIVPALGPVIETEAPRGELIAALDGSEDSREGRAAGAESHRAGTANHWDQREEVARPLRGLGLPPGSGALVAPDRSWFEPCLAVSGDPGGVELLRAVLSVARDAGQAVILQLSAGGTQLQVHPTGLDPSVPETGPMPVSVTRRPLECPVRGNPVISGPEPAHADRLRDVDAQPRTLPPEVPGPPCTPHGGPWVRASMAAHERWTQRRSLAVALLDCATCCGEALLPGPRERTVPRLNRVSSANSITRLDLRNGRSVRIDPRGPGR